MVLRLGQDQVWANLGRVSTDPHCPHSPLTVPTVSSVSPSDMGGPVPFSEAQGLKSVQPAIRPQETPQAQGRTFPELGSLLGKPGNPIPSGSAF